MHKHFTEGSKAAAQNQVPKSLHAPTAHQDAAGHAKAMQRNFES